MIKLKSLINITEQAPQPMAVGAPAPLQTPPTGAEPSPEEQPAVPEPETDLTPSPEDPGEYDWTKDFRAFEDAKNKAESVAKKKLLDKMNKQLVGKKVTINASRGYGQPKTDHTVDSVKKISVEFWYKEWVVIVTDENDKKYFLTPGVNIKIEEGSQEGEPADDQAPTEPDAAQTGATGEEQPNDQAPTSTGTPGAPDAMGGSGTAMGSQPDATMTMGAQDPNAALAQPGMTGTMPPPIPGQPTTPQTSTEQPPENQLPPKKKKAGLAEKTIAIQSIGRDLRLFLLEYMSNSVKDSKGNVNFIPYIKDVKTAINEGKQASVYHSRIEIPINHMQQPLDIRDVKLSVKEKLFSSGNVDQRFSRGSIDISRVGRVYVMDFVKQTGWRS